MSYHVVHAFILIRLYRAALMVAGGIKPAEPHCVLSAIQMVRDIVEAPLRNADGTGSMLMIRVSEAELGKYCHELLKKTRDRYVPLIIKWQWKIQYPTWTGPCFLSSSDLHSVVHRNFVGSHFLWTCFR